MLNFLKFNERNWIQKISFSFLCFLKDQILFFDQFQTLTQLKRKVDYQKKLTLEKLFFLLKIFFIYLIKLLSRQVFDVGDCVGVVERTQTRSTVPTNRSTITIFAAVFLKSTPWTGSRSDIVESVRRLRAHLVEKRWEEAEWFFSCIQSQIIQQGDDSSKDWSGCTGSSSDRDFSSHDDQDSVSL